MDIQSFGFFLVFGLVFIKATVLLAAGLGVAAGLRRAAAGTRHLVWLVTVAGVLALPVLVGLTPMRLEVLPGLPASTFAARAPTPAARVPSRALAVPGRPESLVAPAGVGSPVVRERAWPRPTVGQMLLGGWMATALALLARLAAGVFAVRRIVSAARPGP